VIDGEHYAPVVRDALAALPYEVVGAFLVGGVEKLRGGDDWGVPLVTDISDVNADLVVDLSDEPVLGPRARFALASRALALGLPYVGADFRLDPPRFHPFDVPSLAVIGTGKRVGKTAITGHVARLLSREQRTVVVAMGRGGPAVPELVETPPTVADLLVRSRSGEHAASDFLETAALSGVPTVGCRRAGGGLAGQVFDSNVLEGAALARSLDPDVVVFDGSGAAVPPIAVDARVLVAGEGQDLAAYLNPYRVLISDVIVLVGNAEVPAARDKPVVRVTLRLRPAGELSGSVAVFTTGQARVDHLGADIVHVSRALADRTLLREELERVEADTFLVEVKAAAIDVVAEAAEARGVNVVLADNEVVPVEGDLDEEVLRLVPVRAEA
jgi:cyclic 2,3-diphosphoglycerate synthetase